MTGSSTPRRQGAAVSRWLCTGGTQCDHPELASRQCMIHHCICQQNRTAANNQIAEDLRHYVMTHFACTRISVSELERIIDRADGQP